MGRSKLTLTGKVLELNDILSPDHKAVRIANTFTEWMMLRRPKEADWEEIRRYVYATDTTQTSNSSLPWKNKTTIPKLCQVRDNIYSNYVATMFPKPNPEWITWEAQTEEDETKRDAIVNYMAWAIDQPGFKVEMDKLVLDYIDFGNCFATVEWLDQRVMDGERTQAGYLGPSVRRISPLDIVFNPTAESFESSPKIVRSILTWGEVKDMLEKMSNDENREEYQAIYDYLKDIRGQASFHEGEWQQRDSLYAMDGFGSFRDYLRSNVVEVLTFYGDLYDSHEDVFLKNHVITVIDRHKLIGCKPNPSFFGFPPIFHSPWRRKQDNLWGMGPLDNLVGMQYRLDHVENMKADVFDLTTYPVQKVKGFVQDYTWQPGEKIFVDEEGDVELLVPDVQALNANFEIDALEKRMEEMAGAPREAMGFRTPGEKTAYEVQSLENAASRVFQNKIKQFEEQIMERVLNAMLELAKRNWVDAQTIRVFNDEFKAATFQTLTVQDITGMGRIKPLAARHFAEQAQFVQNLNSLASSPIWQTVQPHFSSVALAKTFENIFDMQRYRIVFPYIAITEQGDLQKRAQAIHEQVVQHGTTATGIGEDFDMEAMHAGMQQPPPDQGQPPPDQGMPQ